MFDKIYVGGRSISASVRVDEHRAPTDDSVRLLNEMERKMLDRIIGSAIVNDNGLEFGYLVMRRALEHGGYDVRWCFVLNGKKHSGGLQIDEREWMASGPNGVRAMVRGRVVKAIGEEIVTRLEVG